LNGENYQKLHESGGTKFCFPSAEDEMIPEWFNHQSRETESGTTFSFWFRNKFPFIMFLISIEESNMDYYYSISLASCVLSNFSSAQGLQI
jgi:hypothetical protein